jgi:hypothetical protein
MPPEGESIVRVRPLGEALNEMALHLESVEPAPRPHPLNAWAQCGEERLRTRRYKQHSAR